MTQQNQYFVAIIPPIAISEEVTSFRNDFKENYNSKASLKNMPHITLKAPFKTELQHHAEVLNWFYNLDVPDKSFIVELHNFGAFDNPKNPVVYVHPVLINAMASLQAAIIKSFETAFPTISLHYHEHAFKPHMTIAYRDLAYAEYKKAWQEYSTKKYSAKFKVNAFYLLQHTGTKWKIIAEYSLK